MTRDKLIEVIDLKTYFYTEAGIVKAVDGVSFDIFKGEVLGIVGESGSGKSVTSLSINRLIPNPPGEIIEGKIIYNNQNLLDLSYEEMRNIRGKDIAMIFQEPMTSLNPVLRIGVPSVGSVRSSSHGIGVAIWEGTAFFKRIKPMSLLTFLSYDGCG